MLLAAFGRGTFAELSLLCRFELFADRQIDGRLFQFADLQPVLLEQIDRLVLVV